MQSFSSWVSRSLSLLSHCSTLLNAFAMSDQSPQGHAAVSAPGSKSSREAELEELRRQSLAQSNAQKLGTFL
jgi:hypothetical protein